MRNHYTFEDFRREAMRCAKSVRACPETRDAIHSSETADQIVRILRMNIKEITSRGGINPSEEAIDFLAEMGWRFQMMIIGNNPYQRIYKVM